MACPYFDPTLQSWDDHALAHRLPLGQAYRGTCVVPPAHVPDCDTQIHICNMGYARGRCLHFPASEAVDAIRFSVLRGSGESAFIWIEEADHRPHRFGNWTAPETPPNLRDRQALAFQRSVDQGKIR